MTTPGGQAGAGTTGLQSQSQFTTTVPAVLAAQINTEHQAAFSKAREALEHARRAGELLLQAKADVGHGAWLPWIEANCKFSVRTAQGYIRLAQGWETLQAKSATVAHLGLREALGLLADAPQPDTAYGTTLLSPDDEDFLAKLRVAGGADTLDERRRAGQIQRRLMNDATENLTAAITGGIKHLSVAELHHAIECLTDCVRILEGWLPEDIVVGIYGIAFKNDAIPYLRALERRIVELKVAA